MFSKEVSVVGNYVFNESDLLFLTGHHQNLTPESAFTPDTRTRVVQVTECVNVIGFEIGSPPRAEWEGLAACDL